ncbi:MAG TPA: signal recognition particle protein [Lentisphaeria bacterium]|nr:MAG: signal recognition particle protein [Lentisphaerae bacterium GWF2_50_93]HCE42014.1 signal recognition particle protein [Lentisphaeria bacterium]
MFENLTDKLHQVFRKISGQGILTESNISEAMDQIRDALLEADVNYNIVKEFVEEVRKDCLGIEVLKTVTPGQQLVKIVNDRLIDLMGKEVSLLDTGGSYPAVIMVVGLHGGGKTTTCAKLAVNLRKDNKKTLLVAGDIYRPAAIDQLEFLGRDNSIQVFSDRNNPNVPIIAKNAVEQAKKDSLDVVVIDTAGRLQIDQAMVAELVRIKQAVNPKEILLVADAALGQQAVSVAEHFHKALTLTGVILTKLDGDARGGAALSIRKVTGCPIKYVGVGEKIGDLDVFHPERMASRILGMGDIVSLVEKAAEEIDKEEAAKLQEKLKSKSFDFNDFHQQLKQMKKMGGLESVLKFLPGGSQLANLPDFDDKSFVHMEAIISSMTKREKENPEIIDFSRRKRIAKGSGTSLEEVGQLIKQFSMMQKFLKQTSLVNRLMSGAPLTGGPSALAGKMRRGSNFTPVKKKRRK